jgi:hypothetical protein
MTPGQWFALIWVGGAVIFAVGLACGKELKSEREPGSVPDEAMGIIWPILTLFGVLLAAWSALCWLARLRIVVKPKEVERG